MTSGQSSGQTPGAGSVCFVGVGPGDEGLLTLRAVERLARADVVVVDQPGRTTVAPVRAARTTSRARALRVIGWPSSPKPASST